MSAEYLDKLMAEHGTQVYSIYNVPKDIKAVYVGRGTILGNPFKTLANKTLESRMDNCISYRHYAIERIANDPDFRKAVEQLYGKVLTCYCSNGTTSIEDGAKYCHAHILVAATNYLHTLNGN